MSDTTSFGESPVSVRMVDVAKAKRNPTVGDMIRSLAVILIPVLIIVVFFTRNLDDHPVRVVDWQPVLEQARKESPYPVLAPTNLPAEWRATRVSWVKKGQSDPGGNLSPRNSWQLGFLDPQDIYIELRQGDLDAPELIEKATREAKPDGESTIAGQPWTRMVTSDDRTRSLVNSTAKVTTIVAGDTGYEQLEAFAATLQG